MSLGTEILSTVVKAIPDMVARISTRYVKQAIKASFDTSDLTRPKKWMFNIALYGVGAAVHRLVSKAVKETIFVKVLDGVVRELELAVESDDKQMTPEAIELEPETEDVVYLEDPLAAGMQPFDSVFLTQDVYTFKNSGWATRESLEEALETLMPRTKAFDPPSPSITVAFLRTSLNLPPIHTKKDKEDLNKYGWKHLDPVIKQDVKDNQFYLIFPRPYKLD